MTKKSTSETMTIDEVKARIMSAIELAETLGLPFQNSLQLIEVAKLRMSPRTLAPIMIDLIAAKQVVFREGWRRLAQEAQ